mmetsp:Transcript_43974/g.80577  ORF Transcript_43974/g.80577 Transcript_43974/m.80577 type:complete len:84 (+) Transcript_43974:125-376(+)
MTAIDKLQRNCSNPVKGKMTLSCNTYSMQITAISSVGTRSGQQSAMLEAMSGRSTQRPSGVGSIMSKQSLHMNRQRCTTSWQL